MNPKIKLKMEKKAEKNNEQPFTMNGSVINQ